MLYANEVKHRAARKLKHDFSDCPMKMNLYRTIRSISYFLPIAHKNLLLCAKVQKF